MALELHINFRPEQQALFDTARRFAVRVVHRRFGKTWQAIAELIAGALMTKRKDWRGFYVAPTFKQAKRIAWDYIKTFCRDMPKVTFNEAELRVDFENGNRIQLLGAETYDSLRGQYADHVVLDEAQLIPSSAWSTVIRPMLADREGRAVIQGTPAGRHNLLFELYDYVSGDDPDWSHHLLTVRDTKVLKQSEVDAMQREMSDAEFEQELLCSFNAAIRGAYFANEMAKADAENRFTTIRYDAAAEVIAALDLGWSDLMVAHFIQPVGTEHHFLKTIAYAETKIADMVNQWAQLPFPISKILLPHDAKQHELTSGTTREETFRSMGYDVDVAPRVPNKHEGIEQTRAILSHCWFDRDECKTTIEALLAYRADYDEVRGVVKMKPVHDWSSHYVDAVQTYATGRPKQHHWGPMSDYLTETPKRRLRAAGGDQW
ncbi:terminase large subunit domain-containing protein [Tropicibacter sp. Alg240-R139]|uniref:terminase large subunit domain-containing protein n=1 Tax=Tropicibacter sp. Alg240-R139 TaxID=2305991 RepID=UPI0013E065B5|nr:terminase family protein [Tropicibacter sp. Alg240-R139]